MLTLEQARDNINEVLRTVRNPALTRDEHDLLRMSLEVLYDGAKESEETKESVGAELEEARQQCLDMDERYLALEEEYRVLKEGVRNRDAKAPLTMRDIPSGSIVSCADPERGPTQDELRSAIKGAKKKEAD